MQIVTDAPYAPDAPDAPVSVIVPTATEQNDSIASAGVQKPVPAEDVHTSVALQTVIDWVASHQERPVDFKAYVVWQCYILGNRKWMISTDLQDGRYFEVTYSQMQHKYFLDVYGKIDNVCILEGTC